MTSPPTILQAAQAIKPYLAELLARPDAAAVGARLDRALSTHSDTDKQQAEILQVLSEAEPTREWLRLYLEEHTSASEILKIIRTYHPLPGKAEVVTSPRYRCPVASCHQLWFRREATAEVPNCPIHGVQMVRDSKV